MEKREQKAKVETKEKKQYVKLADALLAIFRCYAELLRLYYHNEKALTDIYRSTAIKIKTYIERAFQEIIEDFTRKCKCGDSSRVKIILAAMGANAFNESWFNDGLSNLHLLKKDFRIPAIESEFDFQELFKSMRKIEKEMINQNKNSYSTRERMYKVSAFSFLDDNPSTTKTRYYRDFPFKMQILYIHHVYGLIHPDLHKHMIEDSPPMDIKELNSLVSKVNGILPE